MRACGSENEFEAGAARRPGRLAYEMIETSEEKGKVTRADIKKNKREIVGEYGW